MSTKSRLDWFTSKAARRSLDLGLLLLHIAIGATMIRAGLLKAFICSATLDFMTAGGWRAPRFAAAMVTSAETAGGFGLLVGLLTPLAACVVTAAMIDAWAAVASGSAFWSEPFNVPFLAAFGATTLLFTGAGAYSSDARLFGWSSWPGLITGVLFVLAIAAAVATWVLLNGTNPIHFSKPAG